MPEPEPVVETPGVTRPRPGAFDDAADPTGAAAPVREGLPPGFRMRADAHYVDQLDTRMSSIPLRLIDTQSLDVIHLGSDTPTSSFVDSIKRLGILQPLLVSAHGSRYRVIAGRRRLAAAIAAGLREVPCLVQHVDSDAAEQMALASNLPAARPRAVSAPVAVHTAAPAMTEIASALSALVSCADLLSSSSSLSQAVAADLIRAEAGRAMDMLVAFNVLRDEMPIARTRVTAATVLAQVVRNATAEHALRHVSLHIEAPGDGATMAVTGDPRLITDAVSALVAASAALASSSSETPDPRRATPVPSSTLFVAVSNDDPAVVRFTVTQCCVTVPSAWLARPFEIAWPIRDGAGALVRLQVARKIAHTHGGDADVEACADGTLLSLTLPAAQA